MPAPSPPPLPRILHPDPAVQAWCDELIRALDLLIQRLSSPVGATPYVLTAAVPARALNPTTATLPQLGQVVAALITDLKAKGQIA